MCYNSCGHKDYDIQRRRLDTHWKTYTGAQKEMKKSLASRLFYALFTY